MISLSGFGALAPEEKITDKITRRVLAGQNWHDGVVEDRGRNRLPMTHQQRRISTNLFSFPRMKVLRG